MNMEKELTDLIEILGQQRKLAIKSAYKSGEYGYGQVKSFHIALNLLKDLKTRWIASQNHHVSTEKKEIIREVEEIKDNLVQVV